MPDLVDKYFAGDLTEAEKQALSDLLLSSDEAALKFEEAAKQAYLRYGLPDPQPQWLDHPAPPASGGGSSWVWSLVALLATVAALGWFGRHILSELLSSGPSEEVSSPAASTPSAYPIPKKIREKPKVSIPVEKPKPALPQNNQAQAVAPAGSAARTGRSLAFPPKPYSIPVNVGLKPAKNYSNLSVVVGQNQLGFLTVRVMDSHGAQVSVLYQGNLGPGNWVFQWDGKLAAGQAALPGYYQIEIRSGSIVQHKTIQIQ
jgi:hypothetical protein